MKREKFFRQDFYERPELTLNILNELVETKQVAVMDMYSSGEFLYMCVYENDKTKKLLSQVISNMGAYKKYSATHFVEYAPKDISLCALEYHHEHVFWRTGKTIMWDEELRKFVFDEDFDFERNRLLHAH